MPRETLIAGIGQGYVLATPLQLATMTARLANGRHAVRPRLLGGGAAAELGIDRRHLKAVRGGLAAVTGSRRGTAWAARIQEDGLEMAGKTGTSQVRRISAFERRLGIRKNEELPREERDHALFVGYAPLERPRYAAAVDRGTWRQRVQGRRAAGARPPAGRPEVRYRRIMKAWEVRRPGLGIGGLLLRVDWVLVILLALTTAVGFAMLYSAAGGNIRPWAGPHALRFSAGLAITLAVALIDIRFWLRCAYPIYAASLLLVIGVEFMGDIGMGAQRWLRLGPLSVQPSEIMKISLVLALARYFHVRDERDAHRWLLLLIALALIAVPALLVARQPDLGTAAMIAARRRGGPLSGRRLVAGVRRLRHRRGGARAGGLVPVEGLSARPGAHLPRFRTRPDRRRLSRLPVEDRHRFRRGSSERDISRARRAIWVFCPRRTRTSFSR